MNTELATLKDLLTKLLSGEIEAIEYGDHNNPRGVMSGIRIKYIPTMGGKQFRICQLSRGMESGGMYYQEIDDTITQAIKLQTKYTERSSNPIIRKLLDSRPQIPLSWFGIEKMLQTRWVKIEEPVFENETTIELYPLESNKK